MKQFVLVVLMGVLSLFLLTDTAVAVCGDGIIDGGEQCDDGDTNDYNACRNDCTVYDPYFTDVAGNHWAFEFVQQLYEHAISQGYADGTYMPDNTVSRAEMAVYIIRTIDLAGDVTSVIPGTGLSGGGDSGDVTLDADVTYLQRRVSDACASGSMIGAINEDGTVICEFESGDVSAVTAGIGLSGGGTSGDVTVDADTTYLQRRVSSICTVGSSIRVINDDGTVVCDTDDGITSESDPTVLSSVKDGVSWPEITGRPAGLDDGDDVGITSETDPQVGSNTTDYLPKWNGSELVTGSVFDNGLVGIGTTNPTAILDVNGTTGYDQLRLRTSYTPNATTDPSGNIGDITWDNKYIYVKTSEGWKRTSLRTF